MSFMLQPLHPVPTEQKAQWTPSVDLDVVAKTMILVPTANRTSVVQETEVKNDEESWPKVRPNPFNIIARMNGIVRAAKGPVTLVGLKIQQCNGRSSSHAITASHMTGSATRNALVTLSIPCKRDHQLGSSSY